MLGGGKWQDKKGIAQSLNNKHFKEQMNRALTRLIKQLHLECNGVYGARKLHRDLMGLGEPSGRHKVACIMRKPVLKAVRSVASVVMKTVRQTIL